jgi:hypothetical protein
VIIVKKRDEGASLTLTWDGGLQIKAWSDDDLLVSSWYIPFRGAYVTLDDVEQSMRFHMKFPNDQAYPPALFHDKELCPSLCD